jgi:outer membrane protein
MTLNLSRNLLLLFVLCLFVPGKLSAAETSIAYVDVQKLLTESSAAKDIQAQMQKYREKFIADLSKQEQSLNDQRKKLEEEGAKLTKEQLTERKKKFESDFEEARKSAQKRKKDIDAALTRALVQLKEKLFKVVESIAKEKGYAFVLSRQMVVIGDPSADITDMAMEKLNQAVSKIPLDIK